VRYKIPFSLLFFAFAFLCNSAPIEEKDGKTIIILRVYNLPAPASASIISRTNLKSLEQFKQDFPKIFAEKYKAKYKANPEKYGRYNWDNVEINVIKGSEGYIEGVKSDKKILAAENSSDVLYINFRKSCNFIQNGFLLPLDDYYKTLSSEEITRRIDPQVKIVAHRKGQDGNIHWWAMPFGGTLTRAIAFNKSVLAEYGIPCPDKNWTWQDFMEICHKTTDISRNKYGLRLGHGIRESWFWTPFLWSANGKIAAYNSKTQKWEYAFDSDAAVRALDFYTRLSAEKHVGKNNKIHRGYAYKSFKHASTMWENGDIAMMIVYIGKFLITTIDLKKYGLVPLPLGPNGQRGSELNCRMLGINSVKQNAALWDAAWEYMLHIDSLKSQKTVIDMLVKNGKGEAVNPLYLKQFGYDSIAEKADKKLLETFNISLAAGKPEPYRAVSSDLAYDLMTYALNTAEKLAREDKLAPVGSSKRYKQLKLILNRVCSYANKINDKRWKELQKK